MPLTVLWLISDGKCQSHGLFLDLCSSTGSAAGWILPPAAAVWSYTELDTTWPETIKIKAWTHFYFKEIRSLPQIPNVTPLKRSKNVLMTPHHKVMDVSYEQLINKIFLSTPDPSYRFIWRFWENRNNLVQQKYQMTQLFLETSSLGIVVLQYSKTIEYTRALVVYSSSI